MILLSVHVMSASAISRKPLRQMSELVATFRLAFHLHPFCLSHSQLFLSGCPNIIELHLDGTELTLVRAIAGLITVIMFVTMI